MADRPRIGTKVAAKGEVAREMAEAPILEDDTTKFEDVDGPPLTAMVDTYAFAFDIDGVLLRGGKPIPEAGEAMRILNGENEHGIKV